MGVEHQQDYREAVCVLRVSIDYLLILLVVRKRIKTKAHNMRGREHNSTYECTTILVLRFWDIFRNFLGA